MKAPDSTYRFSRLSQIAMLILVIPHSNAEEERIFSIVQKNKTTNLDLKGRLSSILANSQPADAVLKKASWESIKSLIVIIMYSYS